MFCTDREDRGRDIHWYPVYLAQWKFLFSLAFVTYVHSQCVTIQYNTIQFSFNASYSQLTQPQ